MPKLGGDFASLATCLFFFFVENGLIGREGRGGGNNRQTGYAKWEGFCSCAMQGISYIWSSTDMAQEDYRGFSLQNARNCQGISTQVGLA